MRLADKVIIVTGGAMGIGRAYCLGLAKEGGRVVVADLREQETKKVASEIRGNGGEAMAVAVDVTSPEKTCAMAEAAVSAYGRIDVLVNNAGMYTGIKKRSFAEIPPEEWDKVMAVNLKGLFLCAQAVYPAMKRQGKGKIINISSGTIFSGTPFFVHYVTSKAGVIGFTRALARELGSDNIAVNAVTPGLTLSGPQQRDVLTAEQLADRRRRRCFQRDQFPEDLVGTIIFLASDDSNFITGQTINVDGGASMH
jgi:NAD(P)-dependent dehydrogenase (short-subunit alcohol dehydrogenase family)